MRPTPGRLFAAVASVVAALVLIAACNTVGDLYNEVAQESGCRILSLGDGTCMEINTWSNTAKETCVASDPSGTPSGAPMLYGPCRFQGAAGELADGYGYAQFLCCINSTAP
jgi:hypothetical protein